MFVAAKVTPKDSMPDLPSQRESATMPRQLGGDEIVPQPVGDQKKRKALKSPERQVAKMMITGNLSFLDRSEFRQTTIGEKRKKRKKPKQKRTISMARDADPVERQQLAQQLDKERLHLLERKWHGFGNTNSQRRGVFNSKRE
ncbi:hypothetical protein KR044_011156 [Drosophila immigrans]|nr:hypothetical protein KR044_011156 [Drosophila immigrans]